MRAYAADGNFRAAMLEADWLAKQRGRAYAETNHWGMWNGANIVESNLALLAGAELAIKMGQPTLAQQKLAAFQRAWPKAGNIAFVQARLKPLRASLGSTRL